MKFFGIKKRGEGLPLSYTTKLDHISRDEVIFELDKKNKSSQFWLVPTRAQAERVLNNPNPYSESDYDYPHHNLKAKNYDVAEFEFIIRTFE